MVAGGYFSSYDRDLFKPMVESLLEGGDPFFVLKDYDAYVGAQADIDAAYGDVEAWTRKSILSVSRMSPFSMDRLVHQYATQVWNAKPDLCLTDLFGEQAQPPDIARRAI